MGHSLSPQLHQAALQSLGLEGEYCLYPQTPDAKGEQAISRLLEQLRAGKLHGLNVTIPHKQTVLPMLDELTSLSSLVGAVNTLYCRDGRLLGDNTDVPGFLADLRMQFPGLHPDTALVLGAGGSARAVAYALAQAGWQVKLAARRREQAQALAALLQPASKVRFDYSFQVCSMDRASLVESCRQSPPRLLVNTTPVGMFPLVDASPWPDDLLLPEACAVYDLIYNPRQTRLVQRAQTMGLPAADGMGMLVEQAALAFEHWVGQSPSRTAMWRAVQPVSS